MKWSGSTVASMKAKLSAVPYSAGCVLPPNNWMRQHDSATPYRRDRCAWGIPLRPVCVLLIYNAKCRPCKNNCSPADYKGSRERRVGWAVGWRRKEGRLGCGVEVRLGCGVEEGRIGCGVCLLVII